MHHDNKILISAVLILALGLVSSNFIGLTGKVGAGQVDCDSIAVTATKSSPRLYMDISWPPSSPGTSYQGPEDWEVIVRRSSGEKVEDVQIPKEVRGDNPIKFSFIPSISTGLACVQDKCTKQEVCDPF